MKHANILLALVAASALFVNVAFAASMDSAIQNTVVMTKADGSKLEFRHAADGTVKVKLPDGSEATGKWVLEGDTLTHTEDGTGKTHVFNIAGPDRQPGDKWDGTDEDGNPATFEMVAGQ